MRQQLAESYLGHKYWHKDGDKISIPEGTSYTYNGKITSQCSSGDFDVTHRDDASVEDLTDAKKVLIKLPNGIVSIEFRFRYNGIAGDQHILQLFAASGVDFYRYFAQLTIDQGTQQHTSGSPPAGSWFIDTVLPANEEWHTPQTELTDTSNHIGGYTMNTHGYDRIWIVAPTLDTANSGTALLIDWKQL